jgi:AcrR family transcriptional regulator
MIPSGTVIEASCDPDRREAKREAFVAAAREAFFAAGYAGTAMSTIAARVGGSKTTLWTYFPSKQDLFVAVVDDIVERYGKALAVEMDPALPIEEVLRRFAKAMMATVLSEPIIALHRVVTGEAGRFPELGTLFYDRGPRRGKARLAEFMARAMADGRLRQGDPMTASRQFSALCQAGCFQEAVFGIGHPDAALVTHDIEAAIDSFMRAWSAA